MATIYKRNGKWRVQIRQAGFKDISEAFPSKKDADAFAKITEAKRIQGTYIDSSVASDTNFGDCLDKYEQEQTVAKRRSLRQLKSQLNLIRQSDLVKLSILNIKPPEIVKYKEQRMALGISSATYIKDHNLLHRLFEVIQKDWGIELPNGNPVAKVSTPKHTSPTSRNRRLVGNEEELLLRALDKSSYETALVVRLCLATGMRRGELMNIMIRDIDQKRKCLVIPKTKTDHAREIPLTNEAFDALAKQFLVIINSVRQIYPEAVEVSIARLQGKGKVVSLETPKDISNSFMVFHMKPDSITKAFSRACKLTGIEGLTFHDLRHEAISRLFELGLDMMEVSHISGHKDFAMLKKYTHLKPESILEKMQRKQAEQYN